MATQRRINVTSGRALETQAHYSRAVRVGDTVLQAGTTALDRQGRVRGEGDVARQVDAIMAIAEPYRRARVLTFMRIFRHSSSPSVPGSR